jgi:hypothetical protein
MSSTPEKRESARAYYHRKGKYVHRSRPNRGSYFRAYREHHRQRLREREISRLARQRGGDAGLERYKIESMLQAQRGECAICAYTITYNLSALDHDHDTGQVRALLCHDCNFLLGNAREDPVVLHNAIRYLELHGARPKPRTTPRRPAGRPLNTAAATTNKESLFPEWGA